jgi:hypothetical protein
MTACKGMHNPLHKLLNPPSFGEDLPIVSKVMHRFRPTLVHHKRPLHTPCTTPTDHIHTANRTCNRPQAGAIL